MGRLLTVLFVGCLHLASTGVCAYEVTGSDHTLDLNFHLDLIDTSSTLSAWPGGGTGKLRYDGSDSFETSRVTLDYSGRLRPELWARVIVDYVGDGDEGLNIAEAFLTWRPVPRSSNRHQLRVGAMYPPFSYENTATGWTSPYTISFSAINTWLGEEIRPVGVEWSMNRRVGDAGSPHRINIFAAAFYGNDPAATLLFWRGWSIHDRQTRFGDRLDMLPRPSLGGGPLQLTAQTVAPFKELDSKPGFYAGIEWRFANRFRAHIGAWDNRADPFAFDDQQWGWDTRFLSAGLQAELPGDVGLIAQWMHGDTGWIARALQDGTIAGEATVVVDDYDSAFILLTRKFGTKHRASIRLETFTVDRPGSMFYPVSDDGDALTLAWRFSIRERFHTSLEWLQIDSARDVWQYYGMPRSAREEMLRAQLTIDLSL